MKNSRCLWIVAFIFSLGSISSQNATATYTSEAKQAILMDALTGIVLFEKNSDEIMTPSSMTKILTVYMIFERLAQKNLSLEDSFFVSERAWRMGGSKMFVDLGSQVKVKDLLPGIIVQSGNDACITAAEGLSGTEPAFVDTMNRTAHEFGAKHVSFKNTNGWPDEGHVCTVRDLAIIAYQTIRKFPELYKQFYSQTEFTYNKINQRSLNPLLYAGVGGDGLKTGHTDAGGYGLVGSAIDPKGKRLIMVINGLSSSKARKEEAIKLIQYGFRAFNTISVFRKGDLVGNGDVWLGDKSTIKVAAEKDIYVTVESHAHSKLKVELVLEGPIPAPIKTGDPVGKLVIRGSSLQKPFEVTVVAAEDVGKSGIVGRLKAAILYLLLGHNPQDAHESDSAKKR